MNELTVKSQDKSSFAVYLNINSQDEDFMWLLTALYHWENRHPSFTLN